MLATSGIYTRFDFSLIQDPNVLLFKAAESEMNGRRDDAAIAYHALSNNIEAQAHLVRLSADVNLPYTKQLLNLGEVAEQHGSLNTAFHAYNELLRQSVDVDALNDARNRLADYKFSAYIIAAR